MSKIIVSALLLLLSVSFAWAKTDTWAGARTEAQALAASSLENMKATDCMVQSDFYIAHFTAFQEPEGGVDLSNRMETFRPYCQELPHVGKTYLSLDLLDRDVRQMPVALKVVAQRLNPETNEVEIMETLAEQPSRVHPNGVAEIQVTFEKKGQYLLIASIGEAASEDDQLRVPLAVGLPKSEKKKGSMLGMLPLLVLVVIMGAIVFRGRSDNKAPS